ncbi:MAG: Radical SAM superfamily enzyme [Candidatus Methanohalarchaeum thermophilum]|uniref:Radical SAM superfamily enzyme n=1 Tax=Methanohalarchaeum thermophilum TaxID=1903181 RepID=A0A1Q6DS53_METT1|nr:MAG: Radical SAM superfamily enzyme [Candidatus Methanohalarchaeum thermophilum]
MIVFSKLLGNKGTVYDAVRAQKKKANEVDDDVIRFSSDLKPVVMWNITRACNLACKHCYLDAKNPHPDELTKKQGFRLIDDLSDLKIPMLIITGGEPLASNNFFDYINYTNQKNLRTAISSNGTLITPEAAQRMKENEVRYVGVSVDGGIPETHNEFRGTKGSFEKTIEGIKNARDAGLRTGIRITLNKYNWDEVPKLLDYALELGVPRFCVYHLVPTGRGEGIMDWDISLSQRKKVLDFLFEKALELQDKEIEIVTTDSPMDGVYILEKMKENGFSKERIEKTKKLLELSGGCSIGRKVANIDHLGNVNPCHFAPQKTVGNIKNRRFPEIWNKEPTDLLCDLRKKEEELTGKCGECKYKNLCGGCRQKAWFKNGSFYSEDPHCLYDPYEEKLKDIN